MSTAVISTSCSCLQPAAAPGSCCHCGWGSACSNVRTGARVPRAAPAAAAVHCLQHNSPLNPAPCRYRCTGTRRQSCQQLHADTGLLLEPSGWAASLRRAEGWGRGRRSLPRARMGVLPNADRREGESVLQHHPRPAPAASGPTPYSAAPRSCDAGTAAQQGLLGFSILICSANCLVLAKFKCFSQIPSSLSKAFFAS